MKLFNQIFNKCIFGTICLKIELKIIEIKLSFEYRNKLTEIKSSLN